MAPRSPLDYFILSSIFKHNTSKYKVLVSSNRFTCCHGYICSISQSYKQLVSCKAKCCGKAPHMTLNVIQLSLNLISGTLMVVLYVGHRLASKFYQIFFFSQIRVQLIKDLFLFFLVQFISSFFPTYSILTFFALNIDRSLICLKLIMFVPNTTFFHLGLVHMYKQKSN